MDSINLQEFLKEFFYKDMKILNQHKDILKAHYSKKYNYIKIRLFFETAYNQLTKIDPSIGMRNQKLPYLYSIVKSIFNKYLFFLEKTKFLEAIFYTKYLPRSKFYRNILQSIESLQKNISRYKRIIYITDEKLKQYKEIPKNEEELKEYKKLKKANVDAIYYADKLGKEVSNLVEQLKDFENKEREKFTKAFIQKKEEVKSLYENILSAYYYVLNKLLWKEAKKSKAIKEFFEKSQISKVGTKAFIEYQLKNIDLNKVFKRNWYEYLKSILPYFNE